MGHEECRIERDRLLALVYRLFVAVSKVVDQAPDEY